MISLMHFIILAALLFAIGLYGALTKRNAIHVLMSIELMINAVIINLVAFSKYTAAGIYTGQIFAVFVMVIAAAELGVGLAIILSLYKNRQGVDISELKSSKG